MENVAMKRYTSMRVGGTVPYLFYPVDEEDLSDIVRWCRRKKLPYRFLGNGTNLIVADRGLKAGVIRMTAMRSLSFRTTDDGAVAVAAGGLPLKTLIARSAARGLSGLQKLFGIPGTVGGAIKMNAGSFGVAVSDCLVAVRVMDAKGTIRSIERERLDFGYRSSPFANDECVVEASFRLTADSRERIKSDMDDVWGQRCEKHPMDFPSAGSIFKNTSGVPCWKRIDEAGLRGLAIGGARVSEKHANFIINTGGARADDVKRLIDRVKKDVRAVTGVTLEEEVELWGFNE
jgi:UDP-N-acetylmuramate dehydrogenase